LKKSKTFVHNKTRMLTNSFILIIFVLMLFTFPSPVKADVPTLLNIEPWISGTETILNITVRHFAPTSSHYIDIIQVDVNGTVNDVNLNSQSINPFSVQYNMGELISEPSVRIRAHCNLHGWGGWSASQIIPELSFNHLILVLVLLSTALIILKSKIKIETKVCYYSKNQGY
jgi:desulfoferrodoxin (superoxide reductase-like protein)